MKESSNYSILLVDDETDVLEFMGYNLRKEEFKVYTCNNGKEAIRLARKFLPDLIILDVMMPEMDGIETCREIRNIPELSDILILFLTARNEDYSQIAGFNAGADDYLSKPIKPQVFILRVKALLRRINKPLKNEGIENLDKLTIDKARFLVIYKDKEYELPKKEFKIIELFASNPERVYSRAEIFHLIWDDNVVVSDRTIDVHIRRIREKLGEKIIKTVKGVGYKSGKNYENI